VAYAIERAIQEDGRLCKVVLVGSKSTLQMLAIRDSITSQGYVETHAFDVPIVGDECPVSRWMDCNKLAGTPPLRLRIE
jgi:hypothetical protein